MLCEFKGAQTVKLTTWLYPLVLAAGNCSWTSTSALWNMLQNISLSFSSLCAICVFPAVWGPVVCADSPHWVEVKHGRLELSQLNGSDADGPDIAQVVVPPLLLHCSHLWSHPGQMKQKRKSWPFTDALASSRHCGPPLIWHIYLLKQGSVSSSFNCQTLLRQKQMMHLLGIIFSGEYLRISFVGQVCAQCFDLVCSQCTYTQFKEQFTRSQKLTWN